MKLRVTEEFLWDMYSILMETENVAAFMLNPRAAKWAILWQTKNPIFQKYKDEKNKAKFNKLVYSLKKRGLIRSLDLKGNRAIVLTKDGLGKALKASFAKGEKKKRKDGKWIMLTFDIPQKYKKSRQLLRSILHSLEYKMFQQSIWVTPYDVSEETEKLIQFYSLEKFVKVFLIEEI